MRLCLRGMKYESTKIQTTTTVQRDGMTANGTSTLARRFSGEVFALIAFAFVFLGREGGKEGMIPLLYGLGPGLGMDFWGAVSDRNGRQVGW